MFNFVNKYLKNDKFIPYSQLDYGKLEGNIYYNDLINWKLEIPHKFEIELDNIDFRKELYENATNGLLKGTKKEINEMLSWTNLIRFGNKNQQFRSKIRSREKNENINFEKKYQNWIKSLRIDDYVKPKFNYTTWSENMGDIEFYNIELSKIMSMGKLFGYPTIRMLGLYEEIIIQIDYSFVEKIEKQELIDIMRKSKIGHKY